MNSLQELPRIQEDTIPLGRKGREKERGEKGRKKGNKERSKEERTPAYAKRTLLSAPKELVLRNIMGTTTVERWSDS